jgi:death-on-curing protein
MVERFFVEHPESTSFGVFQQNMLEAAVGRPQTSVRGEDAYSTLPAKAAALTHSRILNHPFRDANKRTGILSGCIFLIVNGCDLVAARRSLLEVALAVAEKHLDLNGLTQWYADERNILPLTEDESSEVQREELEQRLAGME